jgi:hypothetical protein
MWCTGGGGEKGVDGSARAFSSWHDGESSKGGGGGSGLVLSGQQTSAQLHRHILVVYHFHSGDILFHPVGLELILLPVGQEVVDRVLQSAFVTTDP